MEWRGHVLACCIAFLFYLNWFFSNYPEVLTYKSVLNLFGFVVAGLLGTYNGYVRSVRIRISPDFDAYPLPRRILGHRSIVFHSPLMPYLLLSHLNINYMTAHVALLNGDFLFSLVFGFIFGWCVHIFADFLNPAGWDLPTPNTPQWIRVITGIFCFLLTIQFFITHFIRL